MSAVPHETAEVDEPDEHILETVFGARVADCRRYVHLLLTRGVELGLIGPREGSRIWHRHVLNCAVTAPLFRQRSSVCDVGSGAGLPGIVVALARPDLRVTLIEPQLRRCDFLRSVVEDLALPVDIVRTRVEQMPSSSRFDYATARAVAPLERLIRWTHTLWLPNGELVAIKGKSVEREIRNSASRLREMNLGRPSIERFGEGVVDPPTTVVRIQSRSSSTAEIAM